MVTMLDLFHTGKMEDGITILVHSLCVGSMVKEKQQHTALEGKGYVNRTLPFPILKLTSHYKDTSH